MLGRQEMEAQKEWEITGHWAWLTHAVILALSCGYPTSQGKAKEKQSRPHPAWTIFSHTRQATSEK